jgi:phosphoribosylformimino-5-aminoimidazole carboxamide ribotide isomerase
LPSSSILKKASPPACSYSPTSCAGDLDVLIIPAIDLKDGRCVRLKQGDMSSATVFSDDPVAMAKHWAAQGARRLHVVDLNGAIAGRPKNDKVIREMIAAVGDKTPIQLGGGIRDLDAIEAYIDAGVTYVIIGTAAVKNPGFLSDACYAFPGHVIAGLDARDGRVAVEGWSKMTGHDVVDLAKKFEEYGVESIIYTDIGRDGMMGGINIEATLKLAQALKTPVIASGGLNSVQDVQAICARLVPEGIIGVIAGRALYEGKLDLKAAQAAADKALGKV